jgi:hypothetical protein
MSEPHKIIEKEIPWDEFCNILSGDEQLIQIRQKYNERYTSSRNYNTKDRRMFRDENKVAFYNGTDVDYKFEKEFNETVKYGLGCFYPVERIFDTENTGEEEEYEAWDGYCYTRPIKRKLETYKLYECEVRIYGVRHF